MTETQPDSAAPALPSVFTSSLAELMAELEISLVVSTYQAGKVILVRYDPTGARDADEQPVGTINTHFRRFDRPMGIAIAGNRLSIGGTKTVWELRNMPAVAAKLDPPGKYDACYLPRSIHITGNIDIHEMAWSGADELWLVNTRFGCLCTLDVDHSFHPRWRPPFVSALAPEDRCHLNGLAMVDGRPKYVTALGETDTPGGWRAGKARGGLLMDIDTNEVVLRGLSMPHSPRWYQEQLWVLESGEGSLAVVDLEHGSWQTVAQVPGFTRGLDFIGPLAFIGLSKVRESAVFSDIPLVKRLKERTCGVWVVHIESGQTVGFLRFEAGVEEIFAVQILRGTRFPEMLEWHDPRIAQSYVLPDAALAEVVLPTDEELAKSPAAHLQRGLEHYRTGELNESIARFRACLALQPDYPHARYNLGVALGDAECFSEAMKHLQRVIDAEPEHAKAHNTLGHLCARQREPQAAIEHYERALELEPDYAEAHFNLGVALLQTGDYPRGFVEYEWRWKAGRFTPFRSPHPQWDGVPIPDKTLLLHTEQGAGDAVQFARFLPLAAKRCRRLIVVCTAELMPVLSALPSIHALREPGTIEVSEFDTFLPLLSLPRLLDTLDNLPAAMPYVDSDIIRRRKDTERLSIPPSPQRKVGLVWAGSATHPNDRHRSCPLRAFLPVLERPGIAFYSLQKGERTQELAELPPAITVHDLEAQLGDFGDLAVLVEQLELVISVDTAVVHVAGALGKPVWAARLALGARGRDHTLVPDRAPVSTNPAG